MFQKDNQSEIENKIEFYIKNAGYDALTPLQKTVIPAILQGRDLVIETGSGEGKRASFLLPLIIKYIATSPGIKALIITTSGLLANKIDNQFKILMPRPKGGILFASVGYEPNIKRELRLLKKKPHILAGTADRLIDHIRRGNVDFNRIDIVIMDLTEPPEAGFQKDVLFIFSKLPQKQQRIIFKKELSTPDGFDSILHRPQIITTKDWGQLHLENLYYQAHENDKSRTLKDIIIAKNLSRYVIICKTESEVHAVHKSLLRHNLQCRKLLKKGSPSELEISREEFNACSLPGLVTTLNQIPLLKNIQIHAIIYYSLPPRYQAYETSFRFFSDAVRSALIISIISKDEEKKIQQIEEKTHVKMIKEQYPDRDEILKGTIQKILAKIKEEADPKDLGHFKRIIKKNVPIFLRPYFSAYLLKEMYGEKHGSDMELQTLFISIGKNRKVFPKDLSRFFASSLHMDPSDIRNIKILENYSFLDVPAEYSEKAIELLNGKDFRGRKVTVNFAKKRHEGD
ncbi:MAG: DEAD/DEAH box helicase [Spirochaetota bacterium]